jgi:hypothetical protein
VCSEIHPFIYNLIFIYFLLFFTFFVFSCRIQINAEVRDRQLRAWKDLILSYCSLHRSFVLDPATFPYFRNDQINRSLNTEGITAIVLYLIQQGNAEWENESHVRLRILWKSIPSLAQDLYDWAIGQGLGSVYTIYELHASDDFTDALFHGTDVSLLRRALAVLAEQHKCVLIPGATADEDGVKFLATR